MKEWNPRFSSGVEATLVIGQYLGFWCFGPPRVGSQSRGMGSGDVPGPSWIQA